MCAWSKAAVLKGVSKRLVLASVCLEQYYKRCIQAFCTSGCLVTWDQAAVAHVWLKYTLESA